ncbi:MAG: pantoate--beta-alanine ligase [Bacteroidia bacterium]|nr:pantoate--beta-alanine ligase [Bacteroidia bacterium]
MQVCITEKELKEYIAAAKKAGKSIGFVPTMGALHKGHISLIEESKKQCKFTVCSVFVNPNQFNDKKDLERYPRQPEKDTELLKKAGCDLLFMPTEKDIYPKPYTRKFSFGKLDQVLEGKHRPGHFNGVAQVVSRLFELVEPDKAFFGLKDYQQLLVIKDLVKQLKLKIEIVGCAILRDEENLALSSRNALLTEEEYDEATFIPIWMDEVKKLSTRYKASQIKARIETLVAQRDKMKLDYFEICDAETLESIKNFEDAENGSVALIAVHVGKIRLIDNVIL